MTQFTGQISGRGPGGTQAIVWQIPPFYLKVFFAVKTRISAAFPVTSA